MRLTETLRDAQSSQRLKETCTDTETQRDSHGLKDIQVSLRYLHGLTETRRDSHKLTEASTTSEFETSSHSRSLLKIIQKYLQACQTF